MTTDERRRELAERLLEEQGHGHPDHTTEGAFRDLLDAANRGMDSRDQDRRILPISIVKVHRRRRQHGSDSGHHSQRGERQTAVAARRGVTAEYPPALCGRCQIR